MTTPTPMWTRPDWLPELQIVEWPRLEDLRARHVALTAPGRPPSEELCAVVAEAAVDLHAYWDESKQAIDRARTAAGYGPTPTAKEPEPREFVHARDSLPKNMAEADEKAGEYNARVETEQLAREENPAPSTVDEINAVAERERREDQRAKNRFRTQRRHLSEDIEALGTLKLVKLSARGINVLTEVAGFYPEVTPEGGFHRHLARAVA